MPVFMLQTRIIPYMRTRKFSTETVVGLLKTTGMATLTELKEAIGDVLDDDGLEDIEGTWISQQLLASRPILHSGPILPV